MLDARKIKQLNAMLAAHGDVMSITQYPDRANPGDFMVLATMKSPHEAGRVQREFGFLLFGYTALIINAQWLATNLAD